MKLPELKEKLLQMDLSNFNNFKLSKAETILNAEQFVHSEIATLEANKGKNTFKPYYDRLLKFYIIISK